MAKKVTQLSNTGNSSDKEQLLSNSFYALPDNPSSKNFTASQIKGKAYKPSLMLFDWIMRAIDEVNDSFEETDDDLEAIDLEIDKIKDGRTTVEKASKDASGNSISSHYETKSDATGKLSTAKSYADSKSSDALAQAKSYADTKKSEAIQSAKDYSDSEKLPKSEPTLSQMAQSANAVTSRAFVAQAIAQAIAEADDTHITGMSFTETSRGVWQLTLTRKDTTPLTAQFDIPESMILDTSNPPVLEGHNLILTFQGGSTVSVDLEGLVDIYEGSQGDDISISVNNGVISATFSSSWVSFLNTAYSNENTRISNEETRISNETARQTAETTRGTTFTNKLTEWGGQVTTALANQQSDYNSSKSSWNSQVQAIVTEYGRETSTENDIRGLRTNG